MNKPQYNLGDEVIYVRTSLESTTTYQIGIIEAIRQNLEASTWEYFMSTNSVSNASVAETDIVGPSSKAKDYIEVASGE